MVLAYSSHHERGLIYCLGCRRQMSKCLIFITRAIKLNVKKWQFSKMYCSGLKRQFSQIKSINFCKLSNDFGLQLTLKIDTAYLGVGMWGCSLALCFRLMTYGLLGMLS